MNDNSEPEALILDRIFKKYNVMTPTILDRGRINKIFYELSTGKSKIWDRLWGVTIKNSQGEEVTGCESEAFNSLEEAKQYIQSLKSKPESYL